MIDQAKDKKDDALAQKLEAKNKDADQALKLAQEEKEKNELAKGQTGNDKITAQPDSNMANAMQPIGSANVTAEQTEIHSEPEKKGATIASCSTQQKVTILERKGEELKVLVDGKVGYIAASDTDYKGVSGSEKAAPKPIGKARISALALKIHRSTGNDPNYFGTLRMGDNVNVYGEKDGYLEIHVGNQVGFIKAEYTDFAGAKGKTTDPEKESAFDKAPSDLQELLAKDELSASEIASARDMISKLPENVRGDLYEALQAKAVQTKETKEKARPEEATEFANLADSLELLGVQNPSSEMSYAAYLEQLKRDQKLPAAGGMQNWGSIANAMGVSYSALANVGDTRALEKPFWSKDAREQLRQGHSIMACINHQAVRIEAVDEKGLVMTLPETEDGVVSNLSGFESYHGKAEQKGRGKRGILSFDALANAGVDWVITLG